MAAYKTGAFVRSKILYPVLENASEMEASKSRPRWAAHTRLGNVWEYPPPPPGTEALLRINIRSLEGANEKKRAFSISSNMDNILRRVL